MSCSLFSTFFFYTRLFLILTICVNISDAAIITSISPVTSSLGGYSLITLSGSGFYRGGREGSTVVYINNQVCEYDAYHSSDISYVCYTPSSSVETSQASVQMVLLGVGVHEFASCSTTSGVCNMNYNRAYTPTLSSYLRGASASSFLPFYGRFISSTFADYDIRIGNKGLIGETLCKLDWLLPADSVLATTFNTNNTKNLAIKTIRGDDETINGNAAQFGCLTAPDISTARTNFSVTIISGSSGYGRAVMSPSHYSVDINSDTIYSFTVAPAIKSISSSQASTLGGAELTITGTGFSSTCSENNVKLAGLTCDLTTCAYDKLTCIIRPLSSAAAAASSSPASNYPGSRGLLAEVWYSSAAFSGNSATSVFTNQIDAQNKAPSFTSIQAASFSNIFAPNDWFYVERLSGLFTAPYTTTYQFYIQGQDWADLALSSTSSPANLTIIANFTNSPNLFWQQPFQISQPVSLVAGQSYYIRARHQHSPGRSLHLEIGVRIVQNENTPLKTANTLRYLSVAETQTITLATAVRREVQTVTLLSVLAGTWRLSYNGRLTTNLFVNATTNDVSTALRK